MDDIDKNFKDIATNYSVRFKDGFKKHPIAQAENDLIFNFLRTWRRSLKIYLINYLIKQLKDLLED